MSEAGFASPTTCDLLFAPGKASKQNKKKVSAHIYGSDCLPLSDFHKAMGSMGIYLFGASALHAVKFRMLRI